MSKITAEREIALARKQYDAYMNEEVTESQQFGHPVKFARKKLYSRVLDFLENNALFGLFLAGFRGGRWFEHSHPDAAPRVTKFSVDVEGLASKAGAKSEGGLHVFNAVTLEDFASELLKSVTDRYVHLEKREREKPAVELDVDTLVSARLLAMAQTFSTGTVMERHVSDEKREMLAQYLWRLDQTRSHGSVIGKWEHVGGKYRRELLTRADSYLVFFSAMERVVNPYDAPEQPTYADVQQHYFD